MGSAAQETVVLWVSRHEPLPAQVRALESKLGKVRIVQISMTINNAEEVAQLVKLENAKYVVPVLPMGMVARLAEISKILGFEVLWAKMQLLASTKNPEEAQRLVSEAPDRRSIADYPDGTKRIYEFQGFEKVKAVKLETEPF